MSQINRWAKIHQAKQANKKAAKTGRPYPFGAKGCPKCEERAKALKKR